jgi:HAE1 family hydrophobic/amphiphilic exporter-1
MDAILRANPEVALTALSVGNKDGESNVAEAFVHLVPSHERSMNTSEMKEKIRGQLKEFADARPQVKDIDAVGGGLRPFNVNIVGSDQAVIEKVATALYDKLKVHPGLKDVDNTYRPGKPEFQVVPDRAKIEKMGINVASVGAELRTQVEGVTPAKFREEGKEYDIRVRLREDQRNLRDGFLETHVPNVNGSLVKLSAVATPVTTTGPAKINRQDRGRYIQISADIAPGGGMGDVINDIHKYFKSGEIELPPGVTYSFVGQAENFQELASGLVVALTLGILFIFLVLASLYESFVTPFTIMLALPLAVCGAIAALFLTKQSLNIFSNIGIIMLLGVATKNSILLVDYAAQAIQKGKDRATAIIEAGKTRLRPILMTTFALIAGTLPIAMGLNEASRQRVSMGIAIIGGLISSTLLTLIVVPAAFSFVDRFREWSKSKLKKVFTPDQRPPLEVVRRS